MSWSIIKWRDEYKMSTDMGMLRTASGNSVGTGKFTVLLVHVVSTRAGVVTNPDTKVLDGQGLVLKDLHSFLISKIHSSPKKSLYSTL